MRAEQLAACRQLYEEHAYDQCFALLLECDGAEPLDGPDLELLATVAYLSGHDEASDDAWSRAYRAHLDSNQPLPAARAAFWLAFGLGQRREGARASGWLQRAEALVAARGGDCVERGYVLTTRSRLKVLSGDLDEACAGAAEALALADRFADRDLATLAGLVAGHARFLLADPEAGFVHMDEVMVSVTAGEVSPVVAGLAYCSVIAACHEALDVSRAREWTEALTHWCGERPELVPYRGLCLVHRSEIAQLGGSWEQAMSLAQQACQLLTGESSAGAAYYQLGELHRLRGEESQAEDCYRRANQWGFRPEPGLLLLRVTQGRLDAAEAAARRLLAELPSGPSRALVLAAFVDVMVKLDSLAEAREASAEVTAFARELASPLLTAIAEQAQGAVLMADREPEVALPVLRRAWDGWHELRVPHQAAQVRVLIGRALRALGDEESARIEFEAAVEVFAAVGALPDADEARRLLTDDVGEPGRAAGPPGARTGLTPREVEVLRLVATGKSNRDIAHVLVLSEKTVARHLSNIYARLDLPSRAAATAYAYEHHLV